MTHGLRAQNGSAEEYWGLGASGNVCLIATMVWEATEFDFCQRTEAVQLKRSLVLCPGSIMGDKMRQVTMSTFRPGVNTSGQVQNLGVDKGARHSDLAAWWNVCHYAGTVKELRAVTFGDLGA